MLSTVTAAFLHYTGQQQLAQCCKSSCEQTTLIFDVLKSLCTWWSPGLSNHL